jgi:2-succinyl-6-hydroxy-2,4-cyclohexadiene-1-carboxylate synthase
MARVELKKTMYETINGIKYHIEVYGSGQPLMLLHGFTGRIENWAEQIAIMEAHFQLILVDLLGHGRSAKPSDASRYRMEHAAADLVEIMNVLQLEKPVLSGYSMGGRLALYTALHYQDRFRALILESASPGLKTEQERAARVLSDHTLASQIQKAGVSKFIDAWEKQPLFASQARLPAEKRSQQRTLRLQNNAEGLINSLRGMGTGVQPSLWSQLPELLLPICIIVGEEDRKFWRIGWQMFSLLPNAQLHILTQAGHTAHLEQPESYSQVVLGFMASLVLTS